MSLLRRVLVVSALWLGLAKSTIAHPGHSLLANDAEPVHFLLHPSHVFPWGLAGLAIALIFARPLCDLVRQGCFRTGRVFSVSRARRSL